MSKKILWLLMSSLMVISLVVAACGKPAAPTTPAVPATPAKPAAPAPTTTAPTAPTTPAQEKPQQEAVKPGPEAPKYGGTINIVEASETGVWDNSVVPQGTSRATELVYESLVTFDWTQARLGKVDWGMGIVGDIENYGPQLAESWKTPEVGTWVLQIRKGVHFALNPKSEASRLMNGREMTADDVVWNIKRMTTSPTSTTVVSNPSMSKAVTVEKTGQWEVTLKAPVEPLTGWWWIVYGGNAQHIWPREVVEKYGGAQDWRNAVGTGPFEVVDYVPASVTTLIRNPNYWDKDPIGPGKGNQLPYLDTVRFIIIPDVSTRVATIRTARGDWTTALASEDARGLLKTNPKLQYHKYLPGSPTITMRQDKAELPFKDKRVRQALMMATDFDSIKNDLYQGEAEILTWPVPPTYANMYVPVKDLPDAARSLFKYDPAKAKQLLAEAGYPTGFKTKMMVLNVSADMDTAAVYKAMWAKVGVDVELQPRETAVYNSTSTAATWDEMRMGNIGPASATNMLSMYTYSGLKSARIAGTTRTFVDDPHIDEVYLETQKHIIIDMPKATQLLHDLFPYIQERAYAIPVPVPNSYTLWQPWVKNHYGEYRPKMWTRYAWVDQDLKEQMTGKR